jgi:predicted RNA-binding Zn-ribbon protein involved in translation (DUF1610 family)
MPPVDNPYRPPRDEPPTDLYLRAWRELERRRRLMIASFLAMPFALGGVGLALSQFNTPRRVLWSVLFILVAGVMQIAKRLFEFPCPNCGKPITRDKRRTDINPKSCPHCGIRAGAAKPD